MDNRREARTVLTALLLALAACGQPAPTEPPPAAAPAPAAPEGVTPQGTAAAPPASTPGTPQTSTAGAPQATNWTQVATLPPVRAAFALGGFVYALTIDDGVYRAAMDAQGTLSAFVRLPGSASPASGFYAVAVASEDGQSGQVYAVGGGFVDMDGASAATVRASVSADGAMGPWVPAGQLGWRRYDLGAAALGGHVYAAGGSFWSGGSFTGYAGELPVVEVVDGSAGATSWSGAPALPVGGPTRLAALDGHLYALAGGLVSFATPRADGSLPAAWSPTASPRTTAGPRSSPRTLVPLDDKLYAVASDGSVEVAAPDRATGAIDAWTATGASSIGGVSAVVAARGSLVAFSGYPTTTVFIARPDASGRLGPTAAAPSAPSAPLGVSATSTSAKVVVAWRAPTADGGSPVLDYTIKDFSTGDVLGVAGASATSLEVAPPLGAAVQLTVTARNAIGSAESGATAPVIPWTSDVWRPSAAPGAWATGLVVSGSGLRGFALQSDFYSGLDAAGLPWGAIGAGRWWGNERAHQQDFGVVSAAVGGGACAFVVGGDQYGSSSGGTEVLCLDAALAGPTGTLAPRSSPGVQVGPRGLYAIGGAAKTTSYPNPSTSVPLDDVSYAPRDPAGVLGAWTTTSKLPAPVTKPVTALVGDRLYLLAPDFAPDRIFAAQVADDGSLSAWADAGAAPTGARAGGMTTVIASCIVWIDGAGAVLIGQVDAGGAVAWHEGPSLPGGAPTAVASWKGRIYATSGRVVAADLDPRTGLLLPWR